MVRHFYVGSLILVEEDQYVKKVYDSQAILLEDHPFLIARVLGGVPSEKAFELPANPHPIDAVTTGDRLCLYMNGTHLTTDPLVRFLVVANLSIVPSPSSLPPRSLPRPQLFEHTSMPPPTRREKNGNSFDDE